jgi:hypothetical protein
LDQNLIARRFIVLARKLHDDVRHLVPSFGSDLHEIKNAVQSIDKHNEAHRQKEQPKPELVAVLHEPEPEKAQRHRNNRNTQRRDRVRLIVEWLTFLAVAIYGFIAYRQWKEMIRAAEASQQSAYAACLAAKIAQGNLQELQKANTFSQSMANSSTMQAAAGIDAEKAYLVFVPRFPKPEELLPDNSNFGVVYSIKNDGKSAALGVKMGYKAVLVRKADKLRIDEKKLFTTTASYMPAGEIYPPPKPEVGNPVTALIPVIDMKGNLTIASEVIDEITNKDALIAVFGYANYSDYAGTHTSKFCIPLGLMKPGTVKTSNSPNEIKCAAYNHREDNYPFTQPVQLPPITQSPVPDITCAPPK